MEARNQKKEEKERMIAILENARTVGVVHTHTHNAI